MKWKTIQNHPNWEISNIGGLIRNKNTKGIKSTHVHANEYPCVSLDGKSYLIHRLVAEAFIPNPENKPCVDHIDGNKSNADASNLRWVTYHENNSNPNTSWKNARNETPVYRTGKVLDVVVCSYPSIRAAAKEVGTAESNIRKALSQPNRFRAKGYKWSK